MGVIAVIWYIVTIIQVFLGYGTAYRLTRNGGDNGASLFGWLFVMSLASLIPGLGIYLWNINLDSDYSSSSYSGSNLGSGKKPTWMTTNESKPKSKQKDPPWKNPYNPQ